MCIRAALGGANSAFHLVLSCRLSLAALLPRQRPSQTADRPGPRVGKRRAGPDDSIAWEKDPYLNQTSYGYTSTATTVTDPNSHATVYTYDASGRLTQVKDALLNHEDYTYDTSNNKTQVSDKRSNAWIYTYDGMGNVLTAKDPLLHVTTCTYNSHNKVLTTTLAGGESTANTYDGSDNLTQVQQKDSSGTVKATTTLTYPTSSNYGLPSSRQTPTATRPAMATTPTGT